jgi:TPR repeat protein
MTVATFVAYPPDHPMLRLLSSATITTTTTTTTTACDNDVDDRSCNPSESQPTIPHPPSSLSTVQDMPKDKEKAVRLFRKRKTLQVASNTDATRTTKTTSTTDTTTSHQQSSTTLKKKGLLLQRLSTLQELNKLRANEKEMIQRWELPARAWPAYQPNPEQLGEIMDRITIHNCLLRASDNTQCDLSDYNHLPQYIQRCTDWMFQMATTLVFYNLDPPAGLAQFQRLAQRGHIDSMVACGIILVEGLGVPLQEKEGLAWLEKAVELGSAQGCYELGTIYYTGMDGVVDEDVVKAFALFERAAEQDHTAAIYMVADCLVEGEGTERSVARAVPLFYKAAERGHRFSRQRIRELLARVDYPL